MLFNDAQANTDRMNFLTHLVTPDLLRLLQ